MLRLALEQPRLSGVVGLARGLVIGQLLGHDADGLLVGEQPGPIGRRRVAGGLLRRQHGAGDASGGRQRARVERDVDRIGVDRQRVILNVRAPLLAAERHGPFSDLVDGVDARRVHGTVGDIDVADEMRFGQRAGGGLEIGFERARADHARALRGRAFYHVRSAAMGTRVDPRRGVPFETRVSSRRATGGRASGSSSAIAVPIRK